MKKVTYQQVADALNISRVTVWKAVNDKPGIAPDTKRSILQKAVEMGYPISIMSNQESTNNSPITPVPQQAAPAPKNANVAVVVSRPETFQFLDEYHSLSSDYICQSRNQSDVCLSPSDL